VLVLEDDLVSNRIDLCDVWSTAQRWSPLIVASRRDYAWRRPSSCARIPRAGPTSAAATDRSGSDHFCVGRAAKAHSSRVRASTAILEFRVRGELGQRLYPLFSGYVCDRAIERLG
jgi:hypothetical protein